MIEFGIKDFIDIFLVAVIIYYTYRLMKETRSMNVFTGIIVFVLIWMVVDRYFHMRLLGSILEQLVSVGVIGLIVLFQGEIRKFLYSLGAHQRFSTVKNFFFGRKKKSDSNWAVMPIVRSCLSMAKGKVGALIVLEIDSPLDEITATGENLDALVSQRLIENIFFKNSPLHDGAIVIKENRIKAAGCILPVSHDMNIPKELGLRHRAALGISQNTDALAIIVSEETGRISVAQNGQFCLRLSAEQLESIISHAVE